MRKPESALPPADDLPALSAAIRISVNRLARQMRGQQVAGLSASALSALAMVQKHGPLSLSELAAADNVTPAAITRVTGMLTSLGLVRRVVDPSDGRASLLVVAPGGEAALAELGTLRDRFLERGLTRMKAADRRILLKAMPLIDALADQFGSDELG